MLDCPSCHHKNAIAYEFCVQCGTRLYGASIQIIARNPQDSLNGTESLTRRSTAPRDEITDKIEVVWRPGSSQSQPQQKLPIAHDARNESPPVEATPRADETEPPPATMTSLGDIPTSPYLSVPLKHNSHEADPERFEETVYVDGLFPQKRNRTILVRIGLALCGIAAFVYWMMRDTETPKRSPTPSMNVVAQPDATIAPQDATLSNANRDNLAHSDVETRDSGATDVEEVHDTTPKEPELPHDVATEEVAPPTQPKMPKRPTPLQRVKQSTMIRPTRAQPDSENKKASDKNNRYRLEKTIDPFAQ